MANILYVRRAGDASIDADVRAHLTGRGHTVVDHSADADPASALADADLVYLSSTSTTSADGAQWSSFAASYRTFQGGVIAGFSNASTMAAPNPWSELNLITGSITVSGDTAMRIEDDTHALAAGLTGSVTIYTGANRAMGYAWEGSGAAFGSGVERVAVRGTSSNRWTIFGYDVGATIIAGTASGRRVCQAFAAEVFDTAWTADAVALFDAATDWAVAGEPAEDQVSVPVTDLANPGLWTRFPGQSSANLWEFLQPEVTAEHIRSPGDPSGERYRGGLSPVNSPGAGPRTIEFALGSGGLNEVSHTVRFGSGLAPNDTIHHEWTYSEAAVGVGPTSFQEDLTVDPAEVDWSNIWMERLAHAVGAE